MRTTWMALALSQSLSMALSTVAATAVPGEGSDSDLLKCGEAKLSVLFWDVYESALYTPVGACQPEARPLKLEITYLRDIPAADLIKQTRKEWEAQDLEHPKHPEWLATLGTLWPDVKEGDRLELHVDENNISTFYFNGEKLGEIWEPLFGEHFAGIWLSPNTTRPELREALLGDR